MSIRSTAGFSTAGFGVRLLRTTVSLSSGVPSLRRISSASAALLTAESSGAAMSTTCWVRSNTARVASSMAIPRSTTTYRNVLRRMVMARTMSSGVTSSDSSGRRAPGRIIGPPEWYRTALKSASSNASGGMSASRARQLTGTRPASRAAWLYGKSRSSRSTWPG